MAELLTLGEVARMLGVAQHRILYLLSTAKVREPSRIAGRRVWTEQQVRELEAALHKHKQMGNNE
jgi:DNA-binding transcriptional MerR regulator